MSDGTDTEADNDAPHLPQIYPASGMYLAGSPLKPLWTVDWYAYDVEVASDGEHLIRMGPWASSLNDEALSFFDHGRLVSSFKICDLVKDEKALERSVSHFEWIKNRRLDDLHRRFEIETLDGHSFVFDIATGRILPGAVNRSTMYWTKILMALLAFVFVVLAYRGKSIRVH